MYISYGEKKNPNKILCLSAISDVLKILFVVFFSKNALMHNHNCSLYITASADKTAHVENPDNTSECCKFLSAWLSTQTVRMFHIRLYLVPCALRKDPHMPPYSNN